MINTVKVISTEFDKVKKRLIKVLRFGRSDVQTPFEVSPFGVDSNPVAGMVAVYASTGRLGKNYIIGYVRKDQLAGVGELRNYSTDDKGEVKFYTWMKNNGTMEFNGDDDNLVRFSKLEEGFNELRGDFNRHVTEVFALHVHPGVTPGPSSTGPTVTPGQTSNASIEGAKIEEMKTFK